MSRDSQRYRKTYSYYRVQPKVTTLEIIVDETSDWKHSVRVASSGSSVNLSGSTPLSIDGISLSNEDRVLLKDQTLGKENGIYYYEVSENGLTYDLVRASDARQGTLSSGTFVYVEEGTVGEKTSWIMTTNDPLIVDTSNQVWEAFTAVGPLPSNIFSTSGIKAKTTYQTSFDSTNRYPDAIGSNVFFYVSGSKDWKSVFGGDVVGSGSLSTSYSYGGSTHGINIGLRNIFGVASNTYTSLAHTFYGGDGTTSRMNIDSSGNTLLGGTLLVSTPARLYVTGSSTSTHTTMILQAGVTNPTDGAGILDVQKRSGASVLFVSGSGVVGIGTLTPSETFSVHDGSQDRAGLGVSSTVSTLYLGSNTTSEGYRTIGYNRSTGNLDVSFGTVGSSMTSALTVDSLGNVGIGTTAPNEELSVHDGGTDRVGMGVASAVSTLYLGSKANTEAYRTLEFDRSTGNLDINYGNVGSAMTSSLTVNSSGRVGIGTTASLDSRTSVYTTNSNGTDGLRVYGGTGPSNIRIRPAMPDDANNRIIQAGDSGIIFDGGSVDTGAFVIAPWSTFTTGLRMTSSGNIGIGTDTFTGRLYVSGSSSSTTPTVVIREGQPTAVGTPIFHVQSSAGASILYVTGNIGTVGGRIGIGTTQPNAKLHVSSSYGGSSHGISIGQPNLLGLASNTYTSFQHNFYGGDGTTQRLLIDSSGNALLGGALPGLTTNTARLFVTGSSTTSDDTLRVQEGVPSATGGAAVLNVQDNDGNPILFVSGSGGVGIGTDASGLSLIRLYVSSSFTGNLASALIVGSVFGSSINTYKAQNHLFQLADTTEVMRINSTGVGIGTASPSESLSIHNGGPDRVGLDVQSVTSSLYLGSANSGAAYRTLEFNRTTGNLSVTYGNVGSSMTTAFSIDSSGHVLPGANNTFNLGSSTPLAWANVYAYAYPSPSDYRLKKNVSEIHNSLSSITSLRPVEYEYKEIEGNRVGFIAHELAQVYPDLVRGEKDGVDIDGNPLYQEVLLDDLVPHLVCSIKELKAELDAVKAELVALRSQI